MSISIKLVKESLTYVSTIMKFRKTCKHVTLTKVNGFDRIFRIKVHWSVLNSEVGDTVIWAVTREYEYEVY
jgi:hypothetical protein